MKKKIIILVTLFLLSAISVIAQKVQVFDILIKDNIVYILSDSGIYKFSMTGTKIKLLGCNTELKFVKGRMSLSGNGNILYVADDTLRVYDISSESPALTNSIPVEGLATDVKTTGNYLIIASPNLAGKDVNGDNTYGGINIFDISSPIHPNLISQGKSTLDDYCDRVEKIDILNNYVYGFTGVKFGCMNPRLYIWDISNILSPIEAGFTIDNLSGANIVEIKIKDNRWAYILQKESSELNICSIENKQNPTFPNKFSSTRNIPTGMCIVGNSIYCAHADGIDKFDISSPANGIIRDPDNYYRSVGIGFTAITNSGSYFILGAPGYLYIFDINLNKFDSNKIDVCQQTNEFYTDTCINSDNVDKQIFDVVSNSLTDAYNSLVKKLEPPTLFKRMYVKFKKDPSKLTSDLIINGSYNWPECIQPSLILWYRDENELSANPNDIKYAVIHEFIHLLGSLTGSIYSGYEGLADWGPYCVYKLDSKYRKKADNFFNRVQAGIQSAVDSLMNFNPLGTDSRDYNTLLRMLELDFWKYCLSENNNNINQSPELFKKLCKGQLDPADFVQGWKEQYLKPLPLNWNIVLNEIIGLENSEAIFAFNSTVVIFDNGDTLRISNNNGNNWFKRVLPTHMEMAHFINSQNGWAFSNNSPGKCWITKDGGTTWTSGFNFDSNLFLKPTYIQFLNVNTGYLTDGNNLYRTINGGISFEKINNLNTNKIEGLFFNNNNTGYLVGSFRDNTNQPFSIIKTTDSGNTWEYIEIPDKNNSGLNCVASSGEYVLVGRSRDGSYPDILRSENGGDSWDIIYTGDKQNVIISKLQVNSLGEFWALEGCCSILRFRSGPPEKNDLRPTPYNLTDFFMQSIDTGWASGGTILYHYNRNPYYVEDENNLNASLVNVQIYPNPVQNKIYINHNNNYYSFNMHLFNSLGVEVMALNIKENENGITEVDLTKLPNGIYYYLIENNENFRVGCFILIK